MSVRGPDGTLHPAGSLRALEHQSIRDFVQRAADEGYLSGHVVDVGCGKQPYRDIVEAAGGQYKPFDRVYFGGNVSGEDVGDLLVNGYDAILCTQVIQYLHHPNDEIWRFRNMLLKSSREAKAQGHLVLTWATNWAEVETSDLHRFTKAGMERLLTRAGFTIVRLEPREIIAVTLDGENLYAGYGVIARA